MKMLNQNQIDDFHESGFVVLPGFKSKAEVDALKVAALDLVRRHDFSAYKAVFSTGDELQKSNAYHQFFLASANSVRCFFEDGALDDSGELLVARERAINKIGHALHDLEKEFIAFSHGEKLAQLANDIELSRPQIWQSMYIFKQPHIGAEVNWHQDSGFFYTTPQSVTTFWFAIDDATLENGCLWVEPGGHKSPLRQRMIRKVDKTEIVNLDHTPWPDQSKARPVEVSAGTLVCFNGMLPHYSAPNTSENSRNAFTLHVTDGQCVYAPQNWIQRPQDFPVRGFV